MHELISHLPYFFSLALFTLLASAVSLRFYPHAPTAAWLVTLALLLSVVRFNISLGIQILVLPSLYESGVDVTRFHSLFALMMESTHLLFLVVLLSAVFVGRQQPSPAAAGRGPLLLGQAMLGVVAMPWLALVVFPTALWALRRGRDISPRERRLAQAAAVISGITLAVMVAGVIALVLAALRELSRMF